MVGTPRLIWSPPHVSRWWRTKQPEREMKRLIVTEKKCDDKKNEKYIKDVTTVTLISHRYELTRPKPTAVTIFSHRHEMKSERLD